MNGDGIKDIVVGERYGTVFLFSRNADGTLNNDGPFPDVDVHKSSAPAVVDWNGDGLLDMLVGEESTNPEAGAVTIYINNGSATAPSFFMKTVLLTATVEWVYHFRGHPQICDLDGDGTFDVIIGDEDGHVYFHKNIGSNTAPALNQEVTIGIKVSYKSKPFVTDWNEDGFLDMVVGDNSDNLHLYLGNDGTTDNHETKNKTDNNYNLTVNQLHEATSLSIQFETHSQQNMELKLYQSDGRFIYSKSMKCKVGINQVQIPINNISKGMYLLHFSVNNKKIYRKVTIF